MVITRIGSTARLNECLNYGLRSVHQQSLYKDRFVLVIDLRSIEANMRNATGKKM